MPLSLAVPMRTETGVAELAEVTVWRRAKDGSLIEERDRFAILLSSFGEEALPLTEPQLKEAIVAAGR